MPDDRTILIFGHDVVLVRTRQLILQQARYRVRTALTGKEALLILTDPSEKCDLFLICHSVLSPERQDVEDAIACLDVKTCHLGKLLHPSELIASVTRGLA